MITTTFKKYKEYLDKPLSNEDLINLTYYSEKGWYLQLIKEYGIVFALILLEHFKKEETYLECQKIIKSIEDSNKHFGTNYVKSLEEYGNMS